MPIYMRSIGGIVAGVVAGILLNTVLRGESPGDRIIAAAKAQGASAVLYIGANGSVHALDRERGDPINDCKSGGCKTDVVESPFGVVLINKATGRPVDPANIIHQQKIYAWDFELSPGCRRYSPGGEICT